MPHQFQQVDRPLAGGLLLPPDGPDRFQNLCDSSKARLRLVIGSCRSSLLYQLAALMKLLFPEIWLHRYRIPVCPLPAG